MKRYILLFAILLLCNLSAAGDTTEGAEGAHRVAKFEGTLDPDLLGRIAVSKQYRMTNIEKLHVRDGEYYELTLDEAAGEWEGSGAGIKSSSGDIICGSSCQVTVLEGSAVVEDSAGGDCPHKIVILGLPNGNIHVIFGGHSACYHHDDNTVHGGTAHGSD